MEALEKLKSSGPESWRSNVRNLEGIPENSAKLMDDIEPLLNTGRAEERIQEIIAKDAITQQEANKTYGTESVMSASKHRISAMIQVAREFGLINESEVGLLSFTVLSRAN